MQNQHINNPFFDKRDEKFIFIRSKTQYYEIFNKKNKKANVNIVNTILFENGKVKNHLIIFLIFINSLFLI